ncbi:paraquat-inducible protein A [Porticoccus sp.]
MLETAQGTHRELLACPECDLLLLVTGPPLHGSLLCSRCGALVQDARQDSLNRTLALSLTGLILAIPANLLPIMEFTISGLSTRNTMLNGAFKLFESGYAWMAFLVIFCSVIAPLANLLLLFVISAGAHWRFMYPWLPQLLRLYHHLEEWGMLDVYMLGILVALIKIRDLGDLAISGGLYSFVLLLMVATWSSRTFQPEAIWQKLESRP